MKSLTTGVWGAAPPTRKLRLLWNLCAARVALSEASTSFQSMVRNCGSVSTVCR